MMMSSGQRVRKKGLYLCNHQNKYVSGLLPPFGLLYQLRMIDNYDDDECGAVDEIIGRGNRSTQRKPAPVPLCSPQIPH
jgi:hypothetical protein